MLVMEKNRQKRNRSSYRQDEYQNQDRDRRYDFDRENQRTNFGNEYGQDMSRSQQYRGAYDQTRWANDNDYGNNRQSDQFDRYQDYDRGFNNVGGFGRSSENNPSWRQNDRNQ